LTAATHLVATLQTKTFDCYREALDGLQELSANVGDDETAGATLGGSDDELRRRWFQLNTTIYYEAVLVPLLEEAQALLGMTVGTADMAYQSKADAIEVCTLRAAMPTIACGFRHLWYIISAELPETRTTDGGKMRDGRVSQCHAGGETQPPARLPAPRHGPRYSSGPISTLPVSPIWERLSSTLPAS
jgi:hypothetical protein